jgi:hypothetical protein
MINGSNLSATHGIKNLLPLKEEKAAALDDNKMTHVICTCIYAYNLMSSSRTYRCRSYCVNPCYPHFLGLPPSTVAPSTMALISTVASSTVAPKIPSISMSAVAPISTLAFSTVAPIHIFSRTVAPTITEASTNTVVSPSTEAPHDSTRNTEYIPDSYFTQK